LAIGQESGDVTSVAHVKRPGTEAMLHDCHRPLLGQRAAHRLDDAGRAAAEKDFRVRRRVRRFAGDR